MNLLKRVIVIRVTFTAWAILGLMGNESQTFSQAEMRNGI